jgi:glycylpeptide N-tetradecanoyltransferase
VIETSGGVPFVRSIPEMTAVTEDTEAHKFWSRQPIMRGSDSDPTAGYIDPTIAETAPPAQPYPLPPPFEWCTIDVTDPLALQEVHTFLAAHYVEDDDHRFRFLLSPELLQWALTPPEGVPEWILGMRTKTGALVGFISGVPMSIRHNENVQRWAVVNFLCVHAKLRTKKMASVLIAELARRVRVSHIHRAVFCGCRIPALPFCEPCYYHRPLNLKKLNDSGFYPIADEKLVSARKRFALPATVHGNCRLMTEGDIDGVTQLFQRTSPQFCFDVDFTADSVRHLFLPRPNILYSYVVPSPRGPRAFFSFYVMNWKVIEPESQAPSDLRAAYVWYVASDGIQMHSLVADLLNKAVNDAHADVANAVAAGGIQDALVANKFEAGAKKLQFFSYNFRVPPIKEAEMRFLFV